MRKNRIAPEMAEVFRKKAAQNRLKKPLVPQGLSTLRLQVHLTAANAEFLALCKNSAIKRSEVINKALDLYRASIARDEL